MLTRYLYIETPINRALEGPHKGQSANNIKLEFKGLSQKKKKQKKKQNKKKKKKKKKNNNINMIITIRDSAIL